MNQVELNKIYEGFYFFSYTPRCDVFIVTSQKKKTEKFLRRAIAAMQERGFEVLVAECKCHSFYELRSATYEAKVSEKWGLYHDIIGSNFAYGDLEKNTHCEVIFLD